MPFDGSHDDLTFELTVLYIKALRYLEGSAVILFRIEAASYRVVHEVTKVNRRFFKWG
jgi:hypothetical protein